MKRLTPMVAAKPSAKPGIIDVDGYQAGSRVHPEEVVRVVLLLDVGEPRVGGGVVVPHPLDVGLVVLRLGPDAGDDRGEVGVAVSKGRCLGRRGDLAPLLLSLRLNASFTRATPKDAQ